MAAKTGTKNATTKNAPKGKRILKPLAPLPELDGDAKTQFEALLVAGKAFTEAAEAGTLIPPRYLGRARRIVHRKIVEVVNSRKGDRIAMKRATLEARIAKMKAALAELEGE